MLPCSEKRIQELADEGAGLAQHPHHNRMGPSVVPNAEGHVGNASKGPGNVDTAAY